MAGTKTLSLGNIIKVRKQESADLTRQRGYQQPHVDAHQRQEIAALTLHRDGFILVICAQNLRVVGLRVPSPAATPQ